MTDMRATERLRPTDVCIAHFHGGDMDGEERQVGDLSTIRISLKLPPVIGNAIRTKLVEHEHYRLGATRRDGIVVHADYHHEAAR